MVIPGRKFNSTSLYRYGFNGKENDNEVKGDGNQQDYGFRIYDSRVSRFLSVDPITKNYPWYSPYQFAGNKPIWAIDLDGLEENNASTYLHRNFPVLKNPTQQVPFYAKHPVSNFTVSQDTRTGYQKKQSEQLQLERERRQRLENATMDPLASGIVYPIANTVNQYTQNTIDHGVGIVQGINQNEYLSAAKNAGFLALDIIPFVPFKGAGAVTNIPTRLARVIPEEFAGSSTLGAPKAIDVFVTDPSELIGLNTSEQIAQKLTLKNIDGTFIKGPFRIIEFDTPTSGLAQPFNRTNPGFINGGKTAAGAMEYVLPNLKIKDLKNVVQKTIK